MRTIGRAGESTTRRAHWRVAVLAGVGILVLANVTLWAPLALAGGGALSQRDGRTGISHLVSPQRHLGGTVRVPGGLYQVGVDEPEAKAAVDVCELATNGQLCLVYGTMLARMGMRTIAVSSFELDRVEVTRGDYRRCVANGRCAARPLSIVVPSSWRDDYPMTYVSWFDAEAYCLSQGMRLPTESEWEVAARGTRGGSWPWGAEASSTRLNHGAIVRGALAVVLGGALDGLRVTSAGDGRDGYEGLAPVGQFPLGRGPFGTYDQAGNAAEWTADSWSEEGYDGLPLINPRRDVGVGGKRVIRGGSWLQPTYVAQANLRDPHNVLEVYDAREARVDVGFRCARSTDAR